MVSWTSEQKERKKHFLAEIDTRIVERMIRKGEVTQKEYEDAIASLPESGDYVEMDENVLSLGSSQQDRKKA